MQFLVSSFATCGIGNKSVTSRGEGFHKEIPLFLFNSREGILPSPQFAVDSAFDQMLAWLMLSV